MSSRSGRVVTAAVLGVLWAAGMMMRSPGLDLRAVTIALLAGAIVGLVMYWLLDQFGGRLRG